MAAFGGEAIKNCSTRDMSGSGLMPRKLSQFPYSAGRNFPLGRPWFSMQQVHSGLGARSATVTSTVPSRWACGIVGLKAQV
jgi:hypothetical protein